jgi:DoxX-like family
MFYRVDYLVAVLLVGFFAGVLSSKALEGVATSRLGQRYYAAVAILSLLRAMLFVLAMLSSHSSFWSMFGGIVGDLLNLLFGFLFGLAARRKDAHTLLTTPSIFSALCMGLAFTFALAGLGKAFSMAPMTEFFTQSGYSVSFLKFIIIAEIFGAIGLLLPWAILPSLVGLSVDMFGAVLTHIHNGDPLNDSTGAIGMLIRLTAVGALWALGHRTTKSIRSSVLGAGVVALVCLLAAMVGGPAMRHRAVASASQSSQ